MQCFLQHTRLVCFVLAVDKPDEAYSSLLVKRPDLSLEDVCLLDRIQKHLAVTAAAVAHLRREGLIEGRMPHPHISAVVAEATGQQAEYMRKKED